MYQGNIKCGNRVVIQRFRGGNRVVIEVTVWYQGGNSNPLYSLLNCFYVQLIKTIPFQSLVVKKIKNAARKCAQFLVRCYY